MVEMGPPDGLHMMKESVPVRKEIELVSAPSVRVTGATGNVPTEDMAHILHEKAIDTGTDLAVLIVAAQPAEEIIGETLPGQVIKVGSPCELHPLPPEETAGTALPQELVVLDNDHSPSRGRFPGKR